MKVAIRVIGNRKGVVLPKSLLLQVGLEDQMTADITVDNSAIVLRKSIKAVRSGWAKAAKVLADHGQDALLMSEFCNAGDLAQPW
ncbi:AbrB/MazE/SpoVT family DNA-binding domain-containing protein [Acidovorax carolinensis]|uniref:AbrB/MazE/SpoVT family DNA-binding domain-containing protein n=1 Tax=Acidovorax carolinensis TaxID=553814 RepID=A0A240UCA7_9BURK|nr:AbrB/MazE/SpoVT family DNA-binding domain-containing protein [Acidovorax carolinensis]ART55125.1 AbrB/MazE/SpoVT family DNA-binding domain-containing protein [Acidovorax carolinensis]ART59118.1 AbrB/MazE/SpoVT family DNA-binding domain-containing protein [Acidovorax carolinensis]